MEAPGAPVDRKVRKNPYKARKCPCFRDLGPQWWKVEGLGEGSGVGGSTTGNGSLGNCRESQSRPCRRRGTARDLPAAQSAIMPHGLWNGPKDNLKNKEVQPSGYTSKCDQL